MAKKRRRREAKETEFDLTPMIDVTFQLLIFFILVMKFKEVERRHAARIPTDEGQQNKITEPIDQMTLRLAYDPADKSMTYWVNVGASKTPDDPFRAGTLRELFEDRATSARAHYATIYEQLLTRVRKAHQKAPEATKIQLSMAGVNTQISSKHQIEDTAPWGFVTLAVDVCTKYNQELKAKGEELLGVSFKDMQSASGLNSK